MVSVEKGKKQPSLVVMGLAFRMQHALSKNTGFDRRDWSLCVIVLIGDQHVFHVGRIIEQVHREI